MIVKGIRLDRWLVDNGLFPSRERARAAILAKEVLIDERPATTPAAAVSEGSRVRVRGDGCPFVSRGGTKLAHALSTWGLEVTGRVCLDVGASTGGFTDCLLQGGACMVFAVDVGYGQLAYKLRTDPRVRVLERTNARNLPSGSLSPVPTLATMDVSFISAAKVLPAVLACVGADADILVLVKPQFEVGRGRVGKGGVVRKPEDHRWAMESVAAAAQREGAAVLGVTPSPLLGPRGNREFWLWLGRGREQPPEAREWIARAAEVGA